MILNEATIKGLFVWSRIQNANVVELDLRNASVGSLADDEESWPQKGRLRLDGFEYQRISDSPLEEDFLEASEESSGKKYEINIPRTDAPTRLKWLDIQPQFRPQPLPSVRGRGLARWGMMTEPRKSCLKWKVGHGQKTADDCFTRRDAGLSVQPKTHFLERSLATASIPFGLWDILLV